MARVLRDLGFVALLLAMATVLSARLSASDAVVSERSRPESQVGAGALSERPVILLAQKGAAKKKKGAAKTDTTGDSSPAAAEKTTGSDSGLKFSRDIAPILVGNCIGCHNPERKRGKFDLTTFEKLMGGSDVEKVIEPGKPDESHLVLRLRGEETPKMPQGNNNILSEEAIAKIESWVKAGARLDAGIDPKAPLKSYAPTPEQLRAAELKKLPAGERDKMVTTVAQWRWKQASPKTTPEVTSGTHFLLFSTLPKDRAAAVIKGMDTAYAQLRTILSRPGEPALDWPEKTSLFVFNDHISLVEFARTLENRELEASDTGTANFGTQEPYIAVVDPLGGREEPPAVGTKAVAVAADRRRGGRQRAERGRDAGRADGDGGPQEREEYAELALPGRRRLLRRRARPEEHLRAAASERGGQPVQARLALAGQRRAGRTAQDRRHPRHRLRLRRLDHAPSPGAALLPRLCAGHDRSKEDRSSTTCFKTSSACSARTSSTPRASGSTHYGSTR